MDVKIFVAIALYYAVFMNVRPDSLFILKGNEETISPDSLIIDESFFDCDRTKSCRQLGKNTAQGTKAVWEKMIFKSCKEAHQDEEDEKQKHWIQHSGMLHPVIARCIKRDGKLIAVLDHDSEAKTKVTGYEDAGSYQRRLTYESPFNDIITFVDTSASCRQFTRIDCWHMALYWVYDGTWWGYLMDRHNNQMQYIGGGPPDGRGCACGITDTCARDSSNSTLKCNCDANLYTWKFDEGYVTEKARLPISEVRLGDTGTSYEVGYHTIGELECEE